MQSQNANDITQAIIGCAYDVSNSLGIGFVEKVYENALAHRLRQKSSLEVAQQHPIKVHYDGIVVGEFVSDLLVAQTLNYLRATGLEVCLLINFGRSKIEIKCLLPHNNWKSSNS